MTDPDNWEARYKRAVADYAGVPIEHPLDDIEISVEGEEGYSYSEYTFADPSICITVTWGGEWKPLTAPHLTDFERMYRVGGNHAYIDTPEKVAGLIRSLLSPPGV